MENKSLFHSKIFWLNVIAFSIGIIQVPSNVILFNMPWVSILIYSLNIVGIKKVKRSVAPLGFDLRKLALTINYIGIAHALLYYAGYQLTYNIILLLFITFNTIIIRLFFIGDPMSSNETSPRVYIGSKLNKG